MVPMMLKVAQKASNGDQVQANSTTKAMATPTKAPWIDDVR